MPIILLILGLVGTNSPAFAQNWRSISNITEKEASLIEQTVAILKIPVDLSKVDYYRLDGDYAALRLPYEDRYIGPLSSNTDRQNNKSIEENHTSYIDTKDTQSATENNKQEEQMDCRLSNLDNMWGNNPDNISNEDLEKLDNLVDTAVRLCAYGNLNTTILGNRGNAFRKHIDNQQHIDNQRFSTTNLMFFWESYIISEKARIVDFPTAEDIRFAINQIRDLVLNNPKYDMKVYSATEAVIRIYDRETYELLKSRRLTQYSGY